MSPGARLFYFEVDYRALVAVGVVVGNGYLLKGITTDFGIVAMRVVRSQSRDAGERLAWVRRHSFVSVEHSEL